MLRTQVLDHRSNLRVASMFAEKCFELAARVWEKGLINKIDGSCRAFDVEKNHADF